MSKKRIVINENFCFSFKSGNIGTKKEARKYFENHKNEKENWSEKTSKIPIFIDTNVLLNAYNLPKSQRNIFVNFIRSNNSRIYITDQVDEEFQRKRSNFIKNYSNSLQNILKEIDSLRKSANIATYCETLVVKLENLKKRPIVQNDYSTHLESIEDSISRIKEWRFATKDICASLYNDVEQILSPFTAELKSEEEMFLDDNDILEAASLCKFCGNISRAEKSFIYNLYQDCAEEREKNEIET